MREFKIRCSSVGKIMTEPKLKSEVLSVGAKTHVRELARAAIFGVEKQVSSKAMEKGILCEQDSIDLYNAVFFTNHTKNSERRTEDDLTGECDIVVPGVIGKDIKTSWSIDTFPIVLADCLDPLYAWQMRGYMKLWNVPRWEVAYCLVDTPDDLIGFDPPEAHTVSHIPEHHRVTTWTIERDLALEALMVERIQHARRYYAEVLAEFDRCHGGDMPAEALTDQCAKCADPVKCGASEQCALNAPAPSARVTSLA